MNVARDHAVVVRWNLRKEVFVFFLKFSFYKKYFAHFLSAPVAACVAGLSSWRGNAGQPSSSEEHESEVESDSELESVEDLPAEYVGGPATAREQQPLWLPGRLRD